MSDTRRSDARTSVRASTVHGRGVFSRRALRSGTILDEGQVLVLPSAETDHTFLGAYVFALDDGDTGLLLGDSSLCNHSADPNAEVRIDEEHATYRLVALRSLAAGEEILIDYGPQYWEAVAEDTEDTGDAGR